MTFEATLRRTAEEVEAVLDRLLSFDGAPASRVVDAMRYAVLGDGKRLRPFFVVETSRLLGVEHAYALLNGAAVECVHCYSLVHDDLPAMDDDDLRRGRPTVHIAFDEATAILAGDGLLTYAFEILGDEATHPSPAVRAELVSALAGAAGAAGMVGGQMLDLEAEKAPVGFDEIVTLQNLKTGRLFRFSCEAGAILAESGADDRSALGTYADRIGLAFQIADDLLDEEGDTAEIGKRAGKDSEAGKATFVSLLGIDAARRKAEELVEEACAALDGYGRAAETLCEAARFIVRRRK